MKKLTRRESLATGAAAAAVGFWTLDAQAKKESTSPNESIVLGVMGLRNRGKDLVGHFSRLPDVKIAYLCDVDESMFGPCQQLLSSQKAPAPKTVTDFRRILEDKSVDGLVIATPDHWHAMATVHACMAGKHVYTEKPVSHNLVEGRRMVQAARKHNRVVQVGTQRRSSTAIRSLVDAVQGGKIGKVHFARAWITSRRPSIGYAKDEAAPAGVNYDLWLGAAPPRPFNRNHFHYNWHWFWEYGTGELGNNGIHGLDVARWVLGVDSPQAVVSVGGKFFFDDDQKTPDTQTVIYEYPGLNLVWEHRTWTPAKVEGADWGCQFFGEKGTILFDGRGWSIVEDKQTAPTKMDSIEPAHQRNWLDCVKTGARPNADIEIGHLSTALCHLGNISQRVGKRLKWDGAAERFAPGEKAANALLGREYSSAWPLPTV